MIISFKTSNTVAEKIYNKAKTVLLSIVNDDMTDYQKVLTIYNWLIENTHYSTNFDTIMNTNSAWSNLVDNKVLGNYKYNYLESIFNVEENETMLASSNALAKAFVLMCRIEGINAIKVNGSKADSNYHYWNKVYIDANVNDAIDARWYTIDIASSYIFDNKGIQGEGGKNIRYQLPGHSYFMVTDDVISSAGIVEKFATQEVKSETTFDYFANTIFITPDLTVVSAKFNEEKDSQEAYVKEVLKYMHSIVNNKYHTFIEIDMTNNSYASIQVKNIGNYLRDLSYDGFVTYSATAYGTCLYILMTPQKA